MNYLITDVTLCRDSNYNVKTTLGFGEVKQHTGSRRGDNYEKVNKETPVTKASMCHLSLNLRDDATNEHRKKTHISLFALMRLSTTFQ